MSISFIKLLRGGVGISGAQLAEISHALMERDFLVRAATRREPNINEIALYHEGVFDLYGISRDAWTPTIYLDEFHSQQDKQFVWEKFVLSSLVLSTFTVGGELFLEGHVFGDERGREYFNDLLYLSPFVALGDSHDYGGYNIDAPSGARVIGGFDGDDTLRAANTDDVIIGFEGDDLIEGRDGNDILYGGPGRDTLVANLGVDTLIRDEGWDTLF